MRPDVTLSDLLRIEDSADVVEICCPDTGIPLWTTIRLAFLRMVMEDVLYSVPLVGRHSGSRAWSLLRYAATFPRSFAYNALRLHALHQPYPVILMATGVRLLKRDGRYFNCLSDYFVSAAPERTFAVEDLCDWKWPFPRHNDNLLLRTPVRVEGVVKGWLRGGRYREYANALVDLVSRRARNLLGWNVGEDRYQWLVSHAAQGAASFLPRYRRHKSIFQKMGARLLINEEACYGGADNATAILAAKHLDMATAEYQHGAVSAGHDAYNFAQAISASQAYRQTLPEYFLAYGSWWGQQINAPTKKLVVGNPNRIETLIGVPAKIGKPEQILVLGDGLDTPLYLTLCESLIAALGGTYQVVFRPHPFERAKIFSDHRSGFVGKVAIDFHSDIYTSFREAGVVISEVSTGLFEAIGLVARIFIWDTPKARFGYPAHPFQRFSDADELARRIRDEGEGRVSGQDIQSIWAPNWQRNYLEFIDEVLGE